MRGLQGERHPRGLLRGRPPAAGDLHHPSAALVKKDERAPIGYELDVRDLTVIARPSQEFPLGHKEHGVAFLMEQRHLWLRSQRQHVMLRVRATVVKAIRDFFDERGFTLVDAPIFTPGRLRGDQRRSSRSPTSTSARPT